MFYLFQCHTLGSDLHHLLPAHCTGFLTALPSWSIALPQAILYTYLELLLTASYLIRWTELPPGHTLDTLFPGLSVCWFSWPVSSNSSNSFAINTFSGRQMWFEKYHDQCNYWITGWSLAPDFSFPAARVCFQHKLLKIRAAFSLSSLAAICGYD